MPLDPEEMLIDTDALEWKPMGEGAWGKVLRVCAETGSWTVLLKQAAGTFVPPHKHLGPADFYVLSGAVEYRGGVARAGTFAREPLGALHERTSFSEETVYLFTAYGPLAMLGPDGNVVGVVDAEAMQAVADM
ncbi:2,4'-dihydroxyacetophenone dioxygenase family protein [Myxococcota bacterium]|nr:2,4'-dihydroxyacetophenone dioxygenase family protein [Myxococcota bacterium]